MIKVQSQFGVFVIILKIGIAISVFCLIFSAINNYSPQNDAIETYILTIIKLLLIPALLYFNTLFKELVVTDNEIILSCFPSKTKKYTISEITNISFRTEIGGTTGGIITTVEYLTIEFVNSQKLIITSGMYYNYFELKEYFIHLTK